MFKTNLKPKQRPTVEVDKNSILRVRKVDDKLRNIFKGELDKQNVKVIMGKKMNDSITDRSMPEYLGELKSVYKTKR